MGAYPYPLPVIVTCDTYEQARCVLSLQPHFDIAGKALGPSHNIIKDIIISLLQPGVETVVPMSGHAYAVSKGRYTGVQLRW